ncbi:MAG: hypothetical protein ACOVKS_09340 [Aquimonas sp.]
MSAFAARLHVLLARDAPIGLVIRRGPSKQVATLLWDRQRDSFELGQWLKGRIYERRSDLSPDGKHLLYFAMNGHSSWTAISRAPWLKAKVFMLKSDCWNGGGLWTGNARYWLNDGYGHTLQQNDSRLTRDLDAEPSEYFGGECLHVYYHRLMRDGWTMGERRVLNRDHAIQLLERPLGKGWTLRKLAHSQIGAPVGKGCYWDEHELVHLETGQSIACPHWEWAELDGRRLVWANGGKLFAARLGKDGLFGETELHDFSAMRFEAIVAPY